MTLDEAVIKLLKVDPELTSVSAPAGAGSSSASTSKISTKDDNGKTKHFFMKTGSGKDAEVMFQGRLETTHPLVLAND
jgi:protein-ribulosamine 3-kinase